MSDSFEEDPFSDGFDDEEILTSSKAGKGINRHVTVIESNIPRQTTLGGDFVSNIDDEGNEVTYKEIQTIITFGPTHHKLNPENLKTYVYPTNFEVRDYQFDIVSKSLFKNVLCALPTGLGKTFIASTVMLNFYRWTQTSKIVFMAPTRPLVAQQIKACYGITGIPSHDTAILLDKTKKNRAEIWDSKRVFFATPQVVENDLKSGFVNPKDIVCLVIDEAHRAKGNYAYNNVVKFIKRFTSSFRILALTATPASDIDGVQELIDNLTISKVEIRTEDSLDTAKYMKKKTISKITCPPNDEALGIVELLATAIRPTLEKCLEFKIYDITDPYKINAFAAMEASQRVIKNPSISEGLKWMYYFLLQLLAVVGQALRRIHIYGIKSFYSYFKDKHSEFTAKWETKKSTNKYAADFYYHPNVTKLLKVCDEVIRKDENLSAIGQGTSGLFSHTKLERMIEELSSFFSTTEKSDSRVIIFTEFRESALEIVKVIDTYNTNNKTKLAKELKPHIFIGQSREKEKFDDVEFRRKAAPKKKGRKKAKEIEEENARKKAEQEEAKAKNEETHQKRTGTRVGSSENAQEQGMKQQQQKELIRKFKSGEYNIIVATSIGEEGLDIGEVDLIICFDSTSSPIKNIQRMGRTGRKRDGKVLLLFSSNEESKFEKAMGGYDFIQKQIQAGQNLKYEKSDRILPKDIKPQPEKKFIEIPEENDELIHMAEEDNEQFLKIATQATTGSKKAKGKSAKGKKKDDTRQKKLDKRFFMPDNVETGFKSASTLVDKSTSRKKGSEFSFQVDEEEPFSERSNIIQPISDEKTDVSFLSVSDIQKMKSSAEPTMQSILIDDEEEDELDALIMKSDVGRKNDVLDFLSSSLPLSQEKENVNPNSQSLLNGNADVPVAMSPGAIKTDVSEKMKEAQSDLPSSRKRTLGASRRGTINVLQSLKKQAKERPFRPIIVNKSDDPIVVEDNSQPDVVEQPPLKKRQSIREQLKSSKANAEIDPSKFSKTDGYLSPNELNDFYAKCQTCAVYIDDTYFEPKAIKNVSCGVGHSTKMHRFLEFMYNSQ